ncbi:TPA: hypothetical protein U2M34_000654 [Providencia rettgeri]|nr:hypothetical protein [Providencia rettgeri]
MDNSVKKIVATIFTVTVLVSSFSAVASKNSGMKRASSGVILFTGAIVAPLCMIEATPKSVITKCWSDTGDEKTTSVDIRKLRGQTTLLPNSKGTQEFNWINKDHTLGIYTIKYD